MLHKNRIIILMILLILLILCGLCYYNYAHRRPIETFSAELLLREEKVYANTHGVVSRVYSELNEHANAGDEIAEVSSGKPSACRSGAETQADKQAMAEYENAVIMYKDGIITQEEYDKSLNKYRGYKSHGKCNKTSEQKTKIYTLSDGRIKKITISAGDEVREDTVAAEIETGSPLIKAYFSAKNKKQLTPGKLVKVQLIKYPEMEFTGRITTVGDAEMQGLPVNIQINESTADLNLQTGDAAYIVVN